MSAPVTIRSLLKEAVHSLEEAGVPDARYDAEQLLDWAGGPDKTHLYLREEEEASQQLTDRFLSAVQKRKSRVPLQQILGQTWFMGLPFEVNSSVLCPRSDTEILVEETLRLLKERANRASVLDVCCGSGCIGLSLGVLAGCTVTLADLSPDALALASRNAEKLLPRPCRLICSDLFDAVEGKFDMICCNPPYVISSEIPLLMPEVRDHEPKMALDGGSDGLVFYRRLAREAGEYLKEDGVLFLEIGGEQGEAVRRLLSEKNWTDVRIRKDLAGWDRVISARRPSGDKKGEENV